jgi:hypothetical protein
VDNADQRHRSFAPPDRARSHPRTSDDSAARQSDHSRIQRRTIETNDRDEQSSRTIALAAELVDDAATEAPQATDRSTDDTTRGRTRNAACGGTRDRADTTRSRARHATGDRATGSTDGGPEARAVLGIVAHGVEHATRAVPQAVAIGTAGDGREIVERERRERGRVEILHCHFLRCEGIAFGVPKRER